MCEMVNSLCPCNKLYKTEVQFKIKKVLEK